MNMYKETKKINDKNNKKDTKTESQIQLEGYIQQLNKLKEMKATQDINNSNKPKDNKLDNNKSKEAANKSGMDDMAMDISFMIDLISLLRIIC